MRRPLVATVAALAVAVAACSSGGQSDGATSDATSAADDDTTCVLIQRLAESAEPLLEVGVADPEEFDNALDSAVIDFVTTLDALIDVVPEDVGADVEVLRGLVEQHRFQEAIEARAPLDEHARRVCGDPVTPST